MEPIKYREPSTCPHFPGRRCYYCDYASELYLYDPCCLYPETPEQYAERKQREKQSADQTP